MFVTRSFFFYVSRIVLFERKDARHVKNVREDLFPRKGRREFVLLEVRCRERPWRSQIKEVIRTGDANRIPHI